MNKPKSITQLSKEQLEDMCLNLMHVDNEKAKIIEQLEQENQQLKEQNEFLIKRENKLQQIEMMFKNRSVDLEELSKLILEKMKGKDE